MLIGDRGRCAIEYEPAPDPGGVWLFGCVCYWLCGRQVGDYELGTSLRDVLFSWEVIARDRGHRDNPRLMLVEPANRFEILQRGLFGQADVDSETDRLALDEQWGRHLVRPSVDAFDNWNVFLVEDSTTGRMVYGQHSVGGIHECVLRNGEFDEVLSRAIESLLGHYVSYQGQLG